MKKIMIMLVGLSLLLLVACGEKPTEPEDKGIIGIWTAYERESVEIGEENDPVISTPEWFFRFKDDESGYKQLFRLVDGEICERNRYFFDYTISDDKLIIYDYAGGPLLDYDIQLDGDQMVLQTTLCTGDGSWRLTYSLHKGIPTLDACEVD